MDDGRDWTWLSDRGAKTAAPAPRERLLWAVTKTGRRAVLHLREHPHGHEVRVSLDGRFLSSEVLRSGQDVAAASQHRLDGWLQRGWQLEADAGPAQ